MKSRLLPETTQDIQALLDNFLHTWNQKDLPGFMEHFVDEAEFTDVVNQTAIGKSAIAKQHEFAFGVVMKHARLELSNLLMREVVPEVILVTANWQNQGSQTPGGQALPDREGVIQFVVVKDPQGAWKFKLVHNADFSLPYQKRDRFME